MTFIIILIALIIERFFHWSHLRHWRWFARYQQFLSVRFMGWPKYLLLAACIVPPVLVVGLIDFLICHRLYEIPRLIFGVIVLVYCMGPDNLWVQIYSCIRALNKEDSQAAVGEVKKMFGISNVDQPQAFHQAFTRAIFIAANQRIFAVLFWFAIFGPLGAVLYRAVSLCVDNITLGISQTALYLQRLLDWLPARLFTFIFALGGNFTSVFKKWRAHVREGLVSNEAIIGECGIAALDGVKGEFLPEDGTAENEALSLLDRVFVMSLVILAMIVFIT